jgi:hypothetical protein
VVVLCAGAGRYRPKTAVPGPGSWHFDAGACGSPPAARGGAEQQSWLAEDELLEVFEYLTGGGRGLTVANVFDFVTATLSAAERQVLAFV